MEMPADPLLSISCDINLEFAGREGQGGERGQGRRKLVLNTMCCFAAS